MIFLRPLRPHLFLFAAFLSHSVWAITIEIGTVTSDVCGYGGDVSIYIGGGVPPYQAFINGAPADQVWGGSGQVRTWNGAPGGYHTITVTDANMEIATEQVFVESLSAFPTIYSWALPNCGESYSLVYACGSTQACGLEDHYARGVLPLSFSVPSVTLPTDNLCWEANYLLTIPTNMGSYPVMSYTDANGCPGTIQGNIAPPMSPPQIQVIDVLGSCTTSSTGQATVLITGGTTSYSAVQQLIGVYTSDGTMVREPCLTQLENSGSRTITGLPAGDLVFRVQSDFYYGFAGNGFDVEAVDYSCTDEVAVTIPAIASCGSLQGTVFMDYNVNCTKQSNEPGVPNAILEILPGPYYVKTASNGAYGVTIPMGSYTIGHQIPSISLHCATAPVPFTITSSPTPAVVNMANVSDVPVDVKMIMSSGPARPGFTHDLSVVVKNLTPANSGTITVTMELDPTLQFTEASPAPTSITGNTLVWDQTALSLWHQRTFYIHTLVPPDETLIGTALSTSAAVVTTNADGNPDNNTEIHTRTITGSYDPNDKLAWTSSGSASEFVPATDDWIDYTIRFQNTGTDTAFHVMITDTLLSTLDPATIQIGAGSHPFTWQLRDQGTLKFYFLNILLPDSNVNEPLSHGFVSFRIKLRDPQNLQPGDQIINIANIYFDFNAPVITDQNVLVVPVPEVVLNAKVFLGGAYASGLNGDALRTQGLIPLVEPYSAIGYTFNGGGGESIQASVLNVTGANAIVDWVLVEIRSSTQPATVVFSRSALLQRDGDVVDLDGVTPVGLSIPAGNYNVALRHRNHAAVMTASAQSLSMNSALIDFTSSATPMWGTEAQTNVNGTMVLWPGDANFDGVVKYSGADNDRDVVLQAIGGSIQSNTLENVYHSADVNLDGTVKYTGANNDRDIILQTIGGVVPTAVKVGQLP